MDFTKESCEKFVEILASKDPVPGGGGASALVGAVGTALGNMVGSLTVGKKKYAEVEADIIELQKNATTLQHQLLELVQKDAEVFEPLAKAYGMPKETEAEQREKELVMEEALILACSVPLDIMRKCCEAILLQEEFAKKGSALALSDAGVGVVFCKAALQGASLNVFINTGAMKNIDHANKINREANEMLDKYTLLADGIFDEVLTRINRR